MPMQQGDIKLTAQTRTYARVNGQNVPAYEIHFTIRGQGDYAAYVPIQNYTAAAAMAAIKAVADPIIETWEAFNKP